MSSLTATTGNGLIAVPVPTYFTLGQNELPGPVQEIISSTGGEVVENLVFLGTCSSYSMLTPGKSNVLTTAQGLKIGCIGGAYDQPLFLSGEDTVSRLTCSLTTLSCRDHTHLFSVNPLSIPLSTMPCSTLLRNHPCPRREILLFPFHQLSKVWISFSCPLLRHHSPFSHLRRPPYRPHSRDQQRLWRQQ